MMDLTDLSVPGFRVLGPLEVLTRGRSISLGGVKPRSVLASLLLQPNHEVSIDLLVDVLWPSRPPRSAVANVRSYACALRSRLAAAGEPARDRIRTRHAGYAITIAPNELDLTAFEDRVSRARLAAARGDRDAELRLLDSAETLWRGPMLTDLPWHHSWEPIEARLTELRLTAHEQAIKLRIALGRQPEAIAELRGLLVEHPLREGCWRELMLALVDRGDRAEALAAYAKVRRVLAEELGVEPGPELRRTATTVLALGRTSGPSARPVIPALRS